MKKYIVRVEMCTDGVDFGDIPIEANSIEEAKIKAINIVEDGDVDIDWYASDAIDSYINLNSLSEWRVEES